jgi:hypothetical protein
MPRIETNTGVKIALYVLRVYLIVLLLLIVVKFLRLFPSKPAEPKRSAAVMVVRAWPPLAGRRLEGRACVLRSRD